VRTQTPSLLVLERLDGWTAQWNHLVDLSPLPSPFLRSWWLTGTGGPQPRFLLVVRENQLVGGLALEEEHRLGLPCLHMMGAGPLAPDHLDLLAVPGQEDVVVHCLERWLCRPGTRLVRQWGDQVHLVNVETSGYEYQGARYKSLSEIARVITGTHWSGPLFFGIKSDQTNGKSKEAR